MSIERRAEEVVRDQLLSGPMVTAIAGRKVYPLKIPQGTVLPAVTYQRYSSAPHMTLGGYTSESVVMLVSVHALSHGTARQLANAVRAALVAGPLHAIFRTDRDVYHEGSDAYSVNMEFICKQTGGFCYV